ncbi:WD repeat-containing protein 49 isoform 1 [Melia azedarach]|uniref:WD repeat-containing protein 49 isoform 1 n=1 Tax=Melia azedarach TaxID=155640 RepID=A0ACC1Y669_MELAZ|nr:WD repeat-containing protein 49 isoform 1 [Melia azedarach]
MSSFTCNRLPLPSLSPPPRQTPFCRRTNLPYHHPSHPGFRISSGRKSYNQRFAGNISVAKAPVSVWDEKPYEVLPTGKISYLDEQDVVTFLDPPKELIPLDPASYNPAAYLWKKIEDIPEERRHRLLQLLKPRLISRAWEIAGTRYDDPKFAKIIASNVLPNEHGQIPLEFYNCRTSGGPWPIAWINFFKKAIFCSDDGNTYGRFMGASGLAKFASSFSPLYFMVRQQKEVMSTEQPCDLAYEFGDGLFNLHQYPQGFPRPAKHPYPFSDRVLIYIRHVGPGVLVGQVWQEGEELQKLPQKLYGEILMVKDYSASTGIR